MKKKAKLFCAKRDGILPAILPLFEFVKQGILQLVRISKEVHCR